MEVSILHGLMLLQSARQRTMPVQETMPGSSCRAEGVCSRCEFGKEQKCKLFLLDMHAVQAAELEYEAALERRRQEVEAERLRRELAAVEAAGACACAAGAPSLPGRRTVRRAPCVSLLLEGTCGVC